MKKIGAALCCSVALLLGGCGSDSYGQSGDPTTPPTATTSTAAPAPTSSLAAATTSSIRAGTTATTELGPSPTETADSTTDATAENTDETTSATTDDTTASTEATDSSGTPGSDTTDPGSDGVGAEFTPVASPDTPRSTKPVLADKSLPDGLYYASVGEAGDPGPAEGSVVFEIVQLFTGPDCLAHFGEAGEEACVNDYGIETEPTADVVVALDDQFVSVVDAATQQSYRISGTELFELIHGGLPSAGAPPDFLYSGFGFLVTYQGGDITRLEQWWTP